MVDQQTRTELPSAPAVAEQPRVVGLDVARKQLVMASWQLENARADLERVLEKPLADLQAARNMIDLWRGYKEEDIGDAETKLAEEKEVKTKYDEKKDKALKEEIESLMKVLEHAMPGELGRIKMDDYPKQKYVDVEHPQLHKKINSCGPATALGVLKALEKNKKKTEEGAEIEMNEDDVIKELVEMKGGDPFDKDGYMVMGTIIDYLEKKKNLKVRKDANLLLLLETLIDDKNGGVGVVAYNGHSKFITNARIVGEGDSRKVEFKMHDPSGSVPDWVEASVLAKALNRTSSLSNLYLVDKG